MSDATSTNPSNGSSDLKHYVNERPFDPYSAVTLSPEQEKYYLASQWVLMWMKFKRHKLALLSGLYLVLVYLLER